jgi:hypothetical protein
MLSVEVRKLYEEWMAEHDEQAAELIYCAYLHALRRTAQSAEQTSDRDGDGVRAARDAVTPAEP